MKAKFIREGFNVLKGPSDEEMDQLYKGMSREKLSQLLNDTISKRFFDDDDYFYDEDEDTDVRLEQNFDLIERLLLSGAVVNDIETGKVEYAITEEDFELIELLKKHHLTFDADELEEVTDYALTIEMEDLLLSMAEGFNEAFKVLKGPDVSHLDLDIQDYLQALPDNAYGVRIYKSYDNTESLYWKTPPLPHDKVSKHYESEFSLEHGVIYSAAVSHRNEIIVDDEFGYSRKNLPIHTVKHFEEGLEKWDHYYNEIDWDSEKKIYEDFKVLKPVTIEGRDLNMQDYMDALPEDFIVTRNKEDLSLLIRRWDGKIESYFSFYLQDGYLGFNSSELNDPNGVIIDAAMYDDPIYTVEAFKQAIDEWLKKDMSKWV